MTGFSSRLCGFDFLNILAWSLAGALSRRGLGYGVKIPCLDLIVGARIPSRLVCPSFAACISRILVVGNEIDSFPQRFKFVVIIIPKIVVGGPGLVVIAMVLVPWIVPVIVTPLLTVCSRL